MDPARSLTLALIFSFSRNDHLALLGSIPTSLALIRSFKRL